MKIFIIGPTKTGKSSLADYIQQAYHLKRIQMSGRLKDNHPKLLDEHIVAYTTRLGQISEEILRHDPDYFIRPIMHQVFHEFSCILDGVRNPRDFILLFDPKEDVVIRMLGDGMTEFESEGLRLIDETYAYMRKYFGLRDVFQYVNNRSLDVETNFKNNRELYEYIDTKF